MPQIIGYDANNNPVYAQAMANAGTAKQSSIIGYDSNNQPIQGQGSSPTPSGPVSNTSQDNQGSFLDRAFNTGSQLLPTISSLPGTGIGESVGAGVGSLLGPVGTVAGGLLGGVAGGLGSYLLAKKATDILNASDSSKVSPIPTGEDWRQGLINQAFNQGAQVIGASKTIPAVTNFLADHPLLRSIMNFFPQQNLPEDISAMRTGSRSVGEATGSKPLKYLETHYGKQELIDLRTKQQAEQLAKLNALRGTSQGTKELSEAGQVAVASNFAESQANYKNLYDQFDKQVIEPNINTVNVVTGYEAPTPSTIIDPTTGQLGAPTPGKPIIEQQVVRLGVPLLETQKYAGESDAALSKFLGEENWKNLPDYLQTKYKTVLGLIKDSINPTEIQLPGGETSKLAFKEYESLKETRTQLGDLINANKNDRAKVAAFSGLRDALDRDISARLNIADPSGAAEALRQQAQDAFGTHQDIFKPIMDRVYKEYPNLGKMSDPEEMFRGATSDPETASQLKNAFRPAELPILKQGMMNQVIQDSYDSASKLFDVDKIIRTVTDENSAFRRVFSQGTLDGVEDVLRGMRTQNPGNLQTGRGIGFNAARLAIPVVGGALASLAGTNTSERTAIGLGTAIAFTFGPSQFVNRVLLNPENAKIAATLGRTAANSPQAQLLVRTLMKGGLRGVQGYVTSTNSDFSNQGRSERAAHINSQGQIVID
jgi:hypothetical protein